MEPAPEDTRRQLGQIMVDEGFLTEDQLLDALAEHNRSGTPLGKVLVDLGFVSPGAVANALAEQHGGLLRTEYGTSAGLRELEGRASIRTETPGAPPVAVAAPSPPAPAPLGSGLRLAQPTAEAEAEAAPPVEPPAPVAPLAPPPATTPTPVPEPEPEFPPAAIDNARIDELESQLHAVLTERNSLAQNLNDLQAHLEDAAQAHAAGVSAEAEERVGALESQLQAAAANREQLELAQQQAAERIAELEAHLAEATGSRHELDHELQELRSRSNEDASAQLHDLGSQRDAAEARAQALENDLVQLRQQSQALAGELEQLRAHGNEDASAQLQELGAARDAAEARAQALEHDLAGLRERASGHDEGLAAQLSGLEEAVGTLTVERDAAAARAAELEPELDSLRHQLREASSSPVAGSNADVAELRRQLAARERRLAESVGEIAKMNREHRALLQLVERQFQLEETTTSVPEPRGESAHVLFVPAVSGYTLVEREGVAPEVGDTVEIDGGQFVVRRHGPSPLPGPRRRCAYLERA